MRALILIILIGIQFTACAKNENRDRLCNNISSNPNPVKIKITIGNSVFIAGLYDNPAATAFKARLPLTINMTELNGNEKYYDFSMAFPTNASVGGNIKAGDLMLYEDNVLVLFYKNFDTSYHYTKLGFIDNPDQLVSALGGGNVVVTFENYKN